MSIEAEDTGGESEVTYVGGKAIEQTTSGETPDGDHGDELAAAKAAVKAALQEEGKKAAKEAKSARERDPLVPRDRAPEPEDEAVKEQEDREAAQLKQALAERKETAKYKERAKAEIEAMREETRQFYRQLQQEKAQIAQERARIEMLRKDPVRAIRENGWTPEDFITDLATDGTPEGQARRQQRELQQQIAEINAWKQQQAEERAQYQRQQEVAQRQGFRQHVEQQFLATAFQATQDGQPANPHLATFYKGHEHGLIAEADVIAEKYRAVTGKEASFAEITEYLEERAAKWYKSMNGAKAAPVSAGRPTPGSATGRRLGPQSTGERRSLGTTLKDLDGEERLEAAKEAVRAAIHASNER